MPDVRPEVLQALRQALDADAVERVLAQAGARQVQAAAVAPLRDVAAAAIARRLSRRGADWALPAPPVTPALLEAARAAIGEPFVRLAVRCAGAEGEVHTETVVQALAIELASTARQAGLHARSEGRPLCAGCVAVGAARHAEEALLGPLLLVAEA